MAIYDDSKVFIKMICYIGKIPAYEKCRAFEQTLCQLSTGNTSPVIANVTALDPIQDSKTFDGGFVFLTQSYRENTSNGR
jgi:hypothetical protein